ncbi:DegQ family serine endoprotease [Phyllobacterium sp. 21LDTY02-6]|nr:MULTISPECIES: DegQ family serine endoprotease [unclassified Phyllobacterium]MCO4316769.1 DegQ family serine endoprotease [Phyllobacterium sp. 21LDTY02-6]MCX8281659.1 DegQ family serine endoprotease [Phyllobacterium sp. 0TCS1.6C]MCX8294769.1 DegQ family serine endoprotease [Phyllobacterium sp. 0TCS1.6A]
MRLMMAASARALLVCTSILAGVLAGAAVPAFGQTAPAEKELPQTRTELQLSFAPLVKQTAGAVVNVYAAQAVQSTSPFAGDPFFEQFFGRRFNGPPRVQSSLGSGVIADSSGIIVTNNHVIRDADTVKVALSDGREFESKVVLKDESTDLAILKIEAGEPLPFVKLADSDKVEVGDLVLAIGNPFGVGQTVTSGIVSAQARTRVGVSDFDFFIQTDAAINPGNSGGALVDMNGELIGINTAIYSRSGGSIGIGFAIPANMVRAVVETAKGGADTFQRPYIGASFQSVTPDVAESLGMKQPYGALVTSVTKDGPAAKSGLQVGDVVLNIDGVRVDNPDTLGYRMTTAGIGKTVTFDVLSRSKQKSLPVTLQKPDPDSPDNQLMIQGKNPLSGALVVKLSAASARRLGLPDDTEGVAVEKIYPESPAARIGLRPGDIVRGVNGAKIASISDLSTAMSDSPILWRFEFERGGTVIRQIIR